MCLEFRLQHRAHTKTHTHPERAPVGNLFSSFARIVVHKSLIIIIVINTAVAAILLLLLPHFPGIFSVSVLVRLCAASACNHVHCCTTLHGRIHFIVMQDKRDRHRVPDASASPGTATIPFAACISILNDFDTLSAFFLSLSLSFLLYFSVFTQTIS